MIAHLAVHQDPTGIYTMGIRYYHPDLGRWAQQDPAYNRTNLPAGNLYAYANCNPTTNTDPTGALTCVTAALAMVMSVGSIALAWSFTAVTLMSTFWVLAAQGAGVFLAETLLMIPTLGTLRRCGWIY